MGLSQCCEPLEVQRSLYPFLTLVIWLVYAVGRRQQLKKKTKQQPNITSCEVITKDLPSTMRSEHTAMCADRGHPMPVHYPCTNIWRPNIYISQYQSNILCYSVQRFLQCHYNISSSQTPTLKPKENTDTYAEKHSQSVTTDLATVSSSSRQRHWIAIMWFKTLLQHWKKTYSSTEKEEERLKKTDQCL